MSAVLPHERSRGQRLPRLLEPGRKRFTQADRLSGACPAGLRVRNAGAHTLDGLITGIWEELGAHETIRCPVCGGEMTKRSGEMVLCADSHSEPQHGECADCGTRLY